MKKLFSLALAAAFVLTLFSPDVAHAVISVNDNGTYEGEASTLKLGTGLSGTMLDSVYTISGGAVGSDGNWTGDGVTTTLDAAPTKFIATHGSGNFKATQLEAGTGDILLENAQSIDGGTNGTIKLIEASDTLSIIYTGTTIQFDSSDGGIEFALTDATEGAVVFKTNNDTDDYFEISTASNQTTLNFNGQNGKITASGGTIDFSSTGLTTTGTVSAGATTATSFIVGDDTIDVVVDDILRFASNDESSTIEAYGFEAKDGKLRLVSDESDDAGDNWELEADTSTNSLLFTNDVGVADTQATVLTLATSGILTTTNDIVVVNDTATTNAVVDVATFRTTSTGTPANGLGMGISFEVEDGGGAEEQASLDISLSDVTDSSEDADLIYSANVAGTIEQRLKISSVGVFTLDGTEGADAIIDLRADNGDDATDRWRIENDVTTQDFILSNDTSVAGTFVTIFTVSDAGIVTTTDDIIIDGTTPQLTIGSTTGQGSPIIMEGATADAFEMTLAIPDPTADVTYTISGSTSVSSFIPSFQNDATDDVSLIFEGATADAFETTLSFVDPTADQTISVPNNGANSALMTSSLTTNAVDIANAVTGTSNGVLFEGATADAFETTLSPVDPTADQTVSLPNFAVAYALVGSTLTTNNIDAANSFWGVSNGIVLEGATADGFETTISPVDPTADQTISIPNNGAASALMTSALTTNAVDAANAVTGASNGILFEGATADGFETTVTLTDPTADRTVTIPNKTGQVQMASAASVITAGATPTLTVGLSNLYTDTITTDNQDQTITFSGAGTAGDMLTIVFQTDSGGSNDEVITFETTLVNSVGTLTLANATAQRYTVTFMSDGTVWNEVARTAIQS